MDSDDERSFRVDSTSARKRFFLATEDLQGLQYKTPYWCGFGMGRATRYYNDEDLKSRAEQKYGVQGYTKKVADRQKREDNKRKREEEKEDGEKRRKLTKDRYVSELPPAPVIADVPSMCAFMQQLGSEQLDQICGLLAENVPEVIDKVNSYKDVCRLERTKFAQVEPKIAKVLDKLDPEQAFEKSKKKVDKAKSDRDRQVRTNEQVYGRWDLECTHPPEYQRRRVTGVLNVDDSGYGKIDIGGYEVAGDLIGFAKDSGIHKPTMVFQTDYYVYKKYNSGTMRLKINQDEEGLLLEGSYNPGLTGYHGMVPKCVKFTARKNEDNNNNGRE